MRGITFSGAVTALKQAARSWDSNSGLDQRQTAPKQGHDASVKLVQDESVVMVGSSATLGVSKIASGGQSGL
jgi:hypothetical protein|tara:strand:+ start:10868 stop:11083 length:216 start_codon:yes stop_codon:yes gene_type:complete